MTNNKKVSFGNPLSADEPRICYDIGIAFLTMGLVDKALSHLINAATDPDWLPICSAVLGRHFLDHGAPERATVWYRRGLSAPEIDRDARIELARGIILAQRCSSSLPSSSDTHSFPAPILCRGGAMARAGSRGAALLEAESYKRRRRIPMGVRGCHS